MRALPVVILAISIYYYYPLSSGISKRVIYELKVNTFYEIYDLKVDKS